VPIQKPKTMNDYNQSIEEAVALLESTGQFLVVKQMPELDVFSEDDGSEKKIAVFLDTETTGFDSETDKILEIGMVKFEYSADGKIFKILDRMDVYEDPGEPISDEIIEITGITNDMVAGEAFDDAAIEDFTKEAVILIAHNAAFDRPFMEKRFPFLEHKAWACSQRDINWRQEHIESSKQEYIAYKLGFFYTGHRADSDAEAGVHILSHASKVDQQPFLYKMLEQARVPNYRIWATDAPFDAKDILKSRGYRWNPGDDGRPKAWYVDFATEAEMHDECDFLSESIYPGESKAEVIPVTAKLRYSTRY